MNITIAIATLNAAAHLRRLFAALADQTLPREQFEVILMDGGSTDDTRQIGESFGCRVLNRPDLDVVGAKHLAFWEAKGRYLMFLDADEVPEKRDSLERRLRFLQAHPGAHVLFGSGFHCPEGYPFINQYINDYGDPFSFFIYRMSKDNDEFIPFLRRHYRIVADVADGVVVDFANSANLPLLELTGMGATLDLEFFRDRLGERFKEPWSLPHLFYIVLDQATQVAVLHDDPLMHYSAERMKRYFYKLEWRVKNNVYFQSTLGASGFGGRADKYSKHLKWKRLLFVPYVLLILPVTLDTLQLMIRRRRWGYAIHPLLSAYVLMQIFKHLSLRILGHRPPPTTYGSSVKSDAQ